MTDQVQFLQPRIIDNTGSLEPGASVYVYQTGTTTLVGLKDADNNALSNPVVADSQGRVTPIFYTGSLQLRVVVKDAAGNTLDDIDPAPVNRSGSFNASEIVFTPITQNTAADVAGAISNIHSELDAVGQRYCSFASTSNNVFTLTSPGAVEPLTAIPTGMRITFVPDLGTHSQTAAFTLNLDDIAATSARNANGSAITGEYLRDGVVHHAIYDGTYWRVDRGTEFVSGANGQAVKYTDGTMAAWWTMAGDSAGAETWTFPEAFSTAPIVTVTPVSASARFAQIDSTPSTSAAAFSVYNTSGTRQTDSVNLYAFGYWA